MATPDKTPNDSGRKSLTAHVWQTRRAVSKGSDKPKKDFWDKADVLIKGIIGVFTVIAAVLVAVIGGCIQQAVTSQTGKIQESIATQSTGKDYLSIALGILEQKDLPEEMKQNKGLRKWAVDLLNNYSPKQLDSTTADELINGKTNIPKLTFWTDKSWIDSIFSVDNMTEARKRGFSIDGQLLSIGESRDAKLKASSSNLGIVIVRDSQNETSQMFLTSIEPPNRSIFSPDDRYMVVYDKERFSICELGEQPLGVCRLVRPSSGIRSIRFGDNDVIVVTDPNDKETKFDLKGKEVQ